MRLRRFGQVLNVAIGAAFVLWEVGSACAADPIDRAVSILKEVCADQSDLIQSLTVAKEIAVRDGWNLIHEGPTPAPIMHGEGGPKISDLGMWHIPLGADAHMSLSVTAVNPERQYRTLPLSPPFKFDACTIKFQKRFPEEAIDRALEERFGNSIEKEVPSRYVTPKWHFVDRKARGDCGRSISAQGNGTPPKLDALMLMDVGPFPGATEGPFACRRQKPRQ